MAEEMVAEVDVRRSLVFGATRGVGLALVRQLVERGDRVFALVRPESDVSGLAALDVTLIEGDAFSEGDIERAYEIAAPDVVVSTLGGAQLPDGRSVDEAGNVLAIRAAEAREVARFVLVTSLGCGEQRQFMSERSLSIFGNALLAKTIAEDVLKATSLAWTIIRPGGLTNDPASGTGAFYPPIDIHGMIAREDVAALVVSALADETRVGEVLVALDSERIRSVKGAVQG